MRYLPVTEAGMPMLELTRRNLQALLDKLDDAQSARMIVAPDRSIVVRAVEDDEHYSDRAPGIVFMPSTGEFR